MAEDDPNLLLSLFTILFCISLFFSILHQNDVDEYGRDSYDIYNGVPGRDQLGYIVEHDGSYSFWANFLDTNPYYAW